MPTPRIARKCADRIPLDRNRSAAVTQLEGLPAWHHWSKQGGRQMLEAMVEEFMQTGKSSRKYESSGILDE
jgi:hypothetical protein